MDLTEDLFRKIAIDIGGNSKVTFQGSEYDFAEPFARLSVTDSIKKYCVTDSLENIDNLVFLKKSNYDKPGLNTHIKNTDYNFRLNLKTEEDLDYNKEQINTYNNIHDTKTKHYRYKKRY